MAINFPGPWQVDIFYLVDGLTHRQTLNCVLASEPTVGDSFFDISALTNAEVPINLGTVVDDYIDLVAALYSEDVNFFNTELYKVEPLGFARQWYSAHAVNVDGTQATTYSPAAEAIMTYRSAEGGIMKITFEELVLNVAGKVTLAATTGATGAVRDFVLGDDNIWIARDTSRPVSGLYWLLGQNEVIFRKRYR